MKKLFLLSIISLAMINASDSSITPTDLGFLRQVASKNKSLFLPGKLYFRCGPVAPLNDAKAFIGTFKNASYRSGSVGADDICYAFFVPDADQLNLRDYAMLNVLTFGGAPFDYKGKKYKLECVKPSEDAPSTYSQEFNLKELGAQSSFNATCYVSQA